MSLIIERPDLWEKSDTIAVGMEDVPVAWVTVSGRELDAQCAELTEEEIDYGLFLEGTRANNRTCWNCNRLIELED